MSALSNTYLTFSAIGNREDLVDIIYNISPTECPFQAAIGKNKAESTLHEWQTDTLATAVTTNAQVEGFLVSGSTAAATARAPGRRRRGVRAAPYLGR